jgi:uncharacterized membrane protein YdcZ (DUF606 family)
MRRLYFSVISALISTMLLAQDKDVNIKIEKDSGGSFWGTPWVWVVGAAIFIILLVAVARGGGSRQQ